MIPRDDDTDFALQRALDIPGWSNMTDPVHVMSWVLYRMRNRNPFHAETNIVNGQKAFDTMIQLKKWLDNGHG